MGLFLDAEEALEMPEIVGQTSREDEEESRDRQGSILPTPGECGEFVHAISGAEQDCCDDEDSVKADEGQAVFSVWRVARKSV